MAPRLTEATTHDFSASEGSSSEFDLSDRQLATCNTSSKKSTRLNSLRMPFRGRGSKTPTTQEEKKRNVTFNLTVAARKSLHHHDYTPEEFKATWYSKEEYKCFRGDVNIGCDMIESGFLEEDYDVYCRRGLDSYLGATLKQKCKLIKKCRKVVAAGRAADEIALTYSEVSSQAVTSARSQGLKDEICAL